MRQSDHRGIFGKNPHYEFRDRDPVFDRMKTVWRASGLKLGEVAARTHLAYSTLYNWFEAGSTISPRHESVQIFYNAFGIEYGEKSPLREVKAAAKKAAA